MSGPRRERRFFRPDVAKDVDDELVFHLEMRERDLTNEGLAAAEARAAAARRFGNRARIARECRAIDEAWYREQRRASMLMDLRQDVVYALRTLRKAPSFTIVAVLTLALGIGATTAIFSLANWALWRPVPGVKNPGELQQVWSGIRRTPTSFSPSWLSYPNLTDMMPRLQTIAIAGVKSQPINVGVADAAARPVPAAFVTASYFDLLGVRMQAGRPVSAADDTPGSAAAIAVASERFARSSFGSVPAALGRQLHLNGVPFTIVGVAGAGFAGTERTAPVDLWVPGAVYPVVFHMPSLRYEDRKAGGFYEFVARLKPGAAWSQVDAELASMAAWLAAEHPAENAKFKEVRFHLMGPIGAQTLGGREKMASTMMLMLGVSTLVLLIACSNVASLLMMRGIGRGGEVAVRQALGAGRLRLVRQYLTEGAVLWTLGGAAAVLIVWVVMRSADGVALLGQRGGGELGVPLDWRVPVFAGGLSIVVGLLFSAAPAYRAARVTVAETLRQGAPSATGRHLRVGTALTVVQLALSLTLVVGALLLAATIRHLSRVDLGFDASNLYTFTIRPGSIGYSPAQSVAYRTEFERQLRLVPGVESVAVADGAPFLSAMFTRIRTDAAGERLEARATSVISPGFFETLRIPLRRGRLFTFEDLGAGGGKPRYAVVVSDSLARGLFGAAEAVGRTVEFPVVGLAGKRFEIIGVVGDVRGRSLIGEPEMSVYSPAGLEGPSLPSSVFVVRAADTKAAGAAVAKIAAALTPALPPIQPRSMQDVIALNRAPWDALAGLMTTLATVAGVLTAVGLYGVVAFGVALRRREFGVRLALGAAPGRLMWLVFRRTAVITALGLVLGAGGAVALARVLSSRLFGVTPFDPAVWTLAALVLLVTAALASWIPARRAVSVDVTQSLRAL